MFFNQVPPEVIQILRSTFIFNSPVQIMWTVDRWHDRFKYPAPVTDWNTDSVNVQRIAFAESVRRISTWLCWSLRFDKWLDCLCGNIEICEKTWVRYKWEGAESEVVCWSCSQWQWWCLVEISKKLWNQPASKSSAILWKLHSSGIYLDWKPRLSFTAVYCFWGEAG